MRLAINALSTTNLSGWYVISGHIRYWLSDSASDVKITVLCHAQNRDRFAGLGDRVTCFVCPETTAQWFGRAKWERKHLAATLRKIEADVLLSMSGIASPGLPVPEVPYAMNPWPLVPGMARSLPEKLKAALQRRGYRKAVKHAAGIAYLSGYIRDAYQRNAGVPGKESAVVYVGLDPELQAVSMGRDQKFASRTIVAVSAMARHKGVETLVRAMERLPEGSQLILAGAWPEPEYREEIEKMITSLKLSARIEISGHLSRESLLDLYRSAAVFALMSHCESFGIPSVEAQALGTPVVTSDCCAMPEVCGEGALYAAPGDFQGTADALNRLLSERCTWDRVSAGAEKNSQRFTWKSQSPLLLQLLERCMKTS